MIPTPTRVTEGRHHWFLWFWEPAEPGRVRHIICRRVKR